MQPVATAGRQRHSAALVGSKKLYIFGGFDGNKWLSDLYVLDVGPSSAMLSAVLQMQWFSSERSCIFQARAWFPFAKKAFLPAAGGEAGKCMPKDDFSNMGRC